MNFDFLSNMFQGIGGGGSVGPDSYLSSMGLNAGNFTAPEFQMSFTPDYLNALAARQGVSLGDPTLLDRITGNTEQGLYDRNAMATMSLQDKLKQQAQSQALSQLTKTGMAQAAQGQEQQLMQPSQVRLKQGQPVDITSPLLSLLAEKQAIRSPRISLI